MAGADRADLEVDGGWVVVRVAAGCWRLPSARLLAGEDCQAAPAGRDDTPPSPATAGWEPVRTLTGPGIRVAFDDVDPYRHSPHPAAPRLAEADFARWRDTFSLAWAEVVTHHAAYAPELAAGLATLTPLGPPVPGSAMSAVARPAFGAVGAEFPGGPVPLALLLIGEFQRAKVDAVLDLCDFFYPADKRRFRTPWEAGQEPLEQLLRDAYVDLAACAFWQVRAALRGDDRVAAEQRYKDRYGRAADAIATLAGCGRLTPPGEEFVTRLRTALKAL